MPYPQRLLAEDEEIVLDLHPHWKQLVVPLLLIPVVCGVASYVAFILPDDAARTALRWAIAVVAVLLLLRFSLWPYLKWQSQSLKLAVESDDDGDRRIRIQSPPPG